MSRTLEHRNLPIAAVNIILSASLIAAGVAQAIAGNERLAIVLIAVAVFGVASALYARRAGSKDITRVNAMEYRDERDRAIARNGFSVVGASALMLTVAEIIVASIVAPEYAWLPTVQLLVLSVVWAIGNQLSAART